MKFNYKLRRLCGSYYGSPGSEGTGRGSNILYDSTGDVLVSATSNRIQLIDLKRNAVKTLPVEARSDIRVMALSPDDCLLVTVDTRNYCLWINVAKGVILHRMHIGGGAVRDAQFSPCGAYLAIAADQRIQVWRTPSSRGVRQVAPVALHRTFTGFADAVTCLTWSRDSSALVAGGREGAARIFTTDPTRHYVPFTLSGHKRAIKGVFWCHDTNSSSGGGGADASSSSSSFWASSSNVVPVPAGQDEGSSDAVLPLAQRIVSVSEDGAVVTWVCVPPLNKKKSAATGGGDGGGGENDLSSSENDHGVDSSDQEDEDLEVNSDNNNNNNNNNSGMASKRRRLDPANTDASSEVSSKQPQLLSHRLVNRVWKVESRHYVGQDGTGGSGGGGGSLVSSCAYVDAHKLLAIGFASGVFGLYEIPTLANLHTLSVGSNQKIGSCALNRSGEWLALACPQSQQLLVWEWRSESYVLKQRGHSYGMRSMAYSEDGIVICTGGEDGKIKLWNAASGFCYVTLEQSHTAPVTGVAFANASVVVSSSLDGTVRAHDLHRYRTFRTFTSPKPAQFVSVAVDPSGEIVVAGTLDPFHIYCWNVQTGKLIDVLTGHTGPVGSLAFQSTGGILVSGSWDGTAKLWDLYKQNIPTDSLQHTSDVVCVATRPDGRQVCVATLGGVLSFWDVEASRLQCEIDGRRDIAGGRKVNDRMTADNNASSRYFTSVCYSADGSCVLAGGNSKYVCIYEVSQQILLKKFQVTHNRSLDGVLDELNSKNLGDFGPISAHDSDQEDDDRIHSTYHLPGARREDNGMRKSRVEVLTHQVRFSGTGREWAAISGEGLHVYSLEEDMIFDPIALTEDITPASILAKLAAKEYGKALHMALHLNEFAVVRQVLEEIPYSSIALVVKNLPVQHRELERLIQFLAHILEETVHLQFYVEWCLQILMTRGMQIDRHENRSTYMRALRSVHKALQSRGDEIRSVCQSNSYTLEVLRDHLQLSA